jgi:hypothetical protein
MRTLADASKASTCPKLVLGRAGRRVTRDPRRRGLRSQLPGRRLRRPPRRPAPWAKRGPNVSACTPRSQAESRWAKARKSKLGLGLRSQAVEGLDGRISRAAHSQAEGREFEPRRPLRCWRTSRSPRSSPSPEPGRRASFARTFRARFGSSSTRVRLSCRLASAHGRSVPFQSTSNRAPRGCWERSASQLQAAP